MAKYAEVKEKQRNVDKVKEKDEPFARGVWVGFTYKPRGKFVDENEVSRPCKTGVRYLALTETMLRLPCRFLVWCRIRRSRLRTMRRICELCSDRLELSPVRGVDMSVKLAMPGARADYSLAHRTAPFAPYPFSFSGLLNCRLVAMYPYTSYSVCISHKCSVAHL